MEAKRPDEIKSPQSILSSIGFSFLIHGGLTLIFIAFFAFRRPSLIIQNPTEVSLSGALSENGVHHLQDAIPIKSNEKFTSENFPVALKPSAAGAASNANAGETIQKSGILEPNSYFLELQRKIQAQERYPMEARKRGIEATIELSFELNEQGQVIAIHSISQQKPAILIDAAIEAVRAASPFSAPPAGSLRVFQIPIEFKIK